MPDPNVSDRERLLRLIDGGPEAIKEEQRQRDGSAEKKPVVVVPASGAKSVTSGGLASWKAWWAKSGLDVSSLIKLSLAMILLLVAIRSFTDVVRSMGRSEKVAVSGVPAVPEASEADGAETGLRLVGVDWGEPPVALLEDLQSGKTYFAKKNDKIKDMRIKQIFKDKVLASYRGKNVELR